LNSIYWGKKITKQKTSDDDKTKVDRCNRLTCRLCVYSCCMLREIEPSGTKQQSHRLLQAAAAAQVREFFFLISIAPSPY
jgi:hypothetical protein